MRERSFFPFLSKTTNMPHKHSKHCKCKCKKRLNCDLALNGKLKVKENAEFKKDVTIDGELTVGQSLVIPKVNTTTTSPVGEQADLVYNTAVSTVSDSQLNLSDGTKWLTVPSNPVGGVYTINPDGTGDFPTIQAGIDYCSSGLTPVANSNLGPSPPPGSKNVTLNILKGIYNESLFFNIPGFSDPDINDPSTDIGTLQGCGLRLIGDKRPIANMTYMNGGLVETDPSYTANSGEFSLGTLNSLVTLTLANSGHSITVVNTPGPNPNFTNCGIVSGDIIIVTDNTGVTYQCTVTSISSAGNTVNFSGGPVTISGNGATLTFCANVNVIGTNPAAIVYISSGQVEMVGIWFSENTEVTIPNGVYDFSIGGTGKLFALNLLLDCRNSNLHFGLELDIGGLLLAEVADGDINGHISIIGGSINCDIGSLAVTYGNYYVMATTAPLLPGSCLALDSGTRFSDASSVQVNGASGNFGYAGGPGTSGTILIFNTFNCIDGVFLENGASLNIYDSLTIDSCTTGIDLANGGSMAFAGPAVIGTPTITNCNTAVVANLNSQMTIASPDGVASPLVINTNVAGSTGVQLTNGSKFSTDNMVTFTGVTYPRVVDVSSTYNAIQDPVAPNGVLTLTASGPMDSTFLTQQIAGTSALAITLNPSFAPDGVTVYLGKRYSLTSANSFANTLTLTAGVTFIGAGVPSSPGTYNTVTFGKAPGSGLYFTVLNATIVLIEAIVNSTISAGPPAPAMAVVQTVEPVTPTKKLPTLPNLPKRFGRASRLAKTTKSK